MVPKIRVPTLLVQSKDDPMSPFEIYQDPRVTGNPNVEVIATDQGWLGRWIRDRLELRVCTAVRLRVLIRNRLWRIRFIEADAAWHGQPIIRPLTLSPGAAWGATSVILFPHGDVAGQAFLSFLIAGVSAGAVT